MHACIAQCVFNTSMHDAIHVFERQLIEIISEGPDVTRIKYIEATGGYRIVSPRRFVARGEPRRRGQACPGRLSKETLSLGLNNGLNTHY